jgi:hypothetical protein
MTRRSARFLLAITSAALLSLTWASAARAQFVPPGMGMPAPAGSNQIGTSIANPFLNPYAAALSQQPLDTGTMAMYFLAARQASGGIGTGVPSGTRPGPGRVASKDRNPTEAAHAEGANIPGAMASRYFNRTTPVYQGTKRYYNRQARYFPPTGQLR